MCTSHIFSKYHICYSFIPLASPAAKPSRLLTFPNSNRKTSSSLSLSTLLHVSLQSKFQSKETWLFTCFIVAFFCLAWVVWLTLTVSLLRPLFSFFSSWVPRPFSLCPWFAWQWGHSTPRNFDGPFVLQDDDLCSMGFLPLSLLHLRKELRGFWTHSPPPSAVPQNIQGSSFIQCVSNLLHPLLGKHGIINSTGFRSPSVVDLGLGINCLVGLGASQFLQNNSMLVCSVWSVSMVALFIITPVVISFFFGRSLHCCCWCLNGHHCWWCGHDLFSPFLLLGDMVPERPLVVSAILFLIWQFSDKYHPPLVCGILVCF